MDLKKIEDILGRELTPAEKSRMEKTKNILGIDDKDAIWDIITVFEYYGDLCKKIPRDIDASLSKFSGNLSKVKFNPAQAKNPISSQSLLVITPIVIGVLLVYGAAAMWAGYYLGLGRPPQISALLLMPVGYIIALSAVCPGIALMIEAARDLADGIHKKRGGLKAAGAGICFFVFSSVLVLTAQYA